MRSALFLGLTLLCASWTVTAQAQVAPSLPNPPSKEACNEFRAQAAAYDKALNQAASECLSRVPDKPVLEAERDEVRTRCSPVRWPRECASEVQRSDCWSEQWPILANECDADAEAIENAADASKALTKNTLVRSAASAIGAAEKVKNTIRKVEELHSLLARASNYNNLSDSEKLKLHRDIAEKLNALGNPSELSRKLTDMALDKVTKIDTNALSDLNRELNKIVVEHRRMLEQIYPHTQPSESTSELDALNNAIADTQAHNTQANKDQTKWRNYIDAAKSANRAAYTNALARYRAAKRAHELAIARQRREWELEQYRLQQQQMQQALSAAFASFSAAMSQIQSTPYSPPTGSSAPPTVIHSYPYGRPATAYGSTPAPARPVGGGYTPCSGPDACAIR